MGGWSRASAYPLGLLMHMTSQLTASDNTGLQLFLQGTLQGIMGLIHEMVSLSRQGSWHHCGSM